MPARSDRLDRPLCTPGRPVADAPAKRIVGWREWVRFPELSDVMIKAKFDTGARTSALHAWDITPFEKAGEPWIAFQLHPLQRNDAERIDCQAPLHDRREVVNSGGGRELRYVILTTLRLGDAAWPIEVTLTNRDEMGFRLLVGRTAMHGRLVVDPDRSYVHGRRRKKKKKTRAAAALSRGDGGEAR
ncbi:ATP-dependent zinc protease family protein [Oceanibacterium hippocampi]|uniref:Retropepsin-like aspartic endopeptidase domain-containing protein n=1 Tax=Oceanibacterium hippocampi TaxID=745714 RepID=A0A1Y5TRI5_9PROT|nr:ATP-dependent zinc protease [Oceanibacterium hippocampi]SLN70373.1 hypothetical protein OCH7691_03284 [Oceanibacterium hippocampi]